MPLLAQPRPAPDEVYAEAQRVAASEGLKGTDAVRNLLLFLGRSYRENPGRALKEYELATLALGLDETYDSRTDSSVRVTVSRLRAKLAEYYLHEGAASAVLLDVPKGAYALVASYRSQPAAKAAPAGPAPRPRRLTTPLVIAAGVICALAVGGAIGYLAGRSSPRRAAVDPSVATLWTDFASQSSKVFIVFSNPRLAGRPDKGMRLLQPKDGASADEPVLDVFTGTGEVLAVRTLTQTLDALGIQSQVKRSLLFTWDEARTNNLVFVGGQVQNPALLPAARLEKFNFTTSDSPVVRNEKPVAGEPAFYTSSEAWKDGSEYAILALVPGFSPERRILILAGASTRGTEVLAGFVCNPGGLKQLLSRLQAPAGGRVPPFEALLKLDTRGGVPSEPRLVTVHRRSEGANAFAP